MNETRIGAFNTATSSFTIYTDLSWRLKREFILPKNVNSILYASEQILLVELDQPGHTAWVALPEQQKHAIIVQSMTNSIHLKGVLDGGDMVWSPSKICRCQSPWTKVKLFKHLSNQTLDLPQACAIGHALGFNMREMAEIVSDGLCEQRQPRHSIDWIVVLYQFSTASVTKTIQQLIRLGETRIASSIISDPGTYATSKIHQDEYTPLAHLYFECDPPRDDLISFLRANKHFETLYTIELFAKRHDVECVVLVGCIRQALEYTGTILFEMSMLTDFPLESVHAIIEHNQARILVISPKCRPWLRSFPTVAQMDVLLAYPPGVMMHRDWVQRNLPSFNDSQCERLLQWFDPRTIGTKAEVIGDDVPIQHLSKIDASTSERWHAEPVERLELFLCILIRLGKLDDLKEFLERLPGEYRPSVLAFRCFDADSPALQWVYAVHGAWAEELGYRCQLATSKAELLQIVHELVDRGDSVAVLVSVLLRCETLGISFDDVLLNHEKRLMPTLATILFDRSNEVSGILEHHRNEDMARCRTLEYSGEVLSHVIRYELAQHESSSNGIRSLDRLADMVLTNMKQHQLSNPGPEHGFTFSFRSLKQKCQAELETHLVVFSCGHQYTRERFHHTVIPDFIQRMSRLPKALNHLKTLLINEYQQTPLQVACPECVLDYLSLVCGGKCRDEESAVGSSRD